MYRMKGVLRKSDDLASIYINQITIEIMASCAFAFKDLLCLVLAKQLRGQALVARMPQVGDGLEQMSQHSKSSESRFIYASSLMTLPTYLHRSQKACDPIL